MQIEENILRRYIRKIINTAKSENKSQLKEERKLRGIVRKLIRESEEDAPHSSTGINVLKDLLNMVVPTLEAGYKKLTSDVEQRKSFRAHVIKAVVNLLSTANAYIGSDSSGGDAAMPASPETPVPAAPEAAPSGAPKELDELDIQVGNDQAAQTKAPAGPKADPAFIATDKDKKKEAGEAKNKDKSPSSFEAIPQLDPTGRNYAMDTFDRVQKQIYEAYNILGNEKDRQLFYDYLITNLKLHFDKMEDELQSTVQEPTTQAYQTEKDKQKALEPTADPAANAAAQMPPPAGAAPVPPPVAGAAPAPAGLPPV